MKAKCKWISIKLLHFSNCLISFDWNRFCSLLLEFFILNVQFNYHNNQTDNKANNNQRPKRFFCNFHCFFLGAGFFLNADAFSDSDTPTFPPGVTTRAFINDFRLLAFPGFLFRNIRIVFIWGHGLPVHEFTRFTRKYSHITQRLFNSQ